MSGPNAGEPCVASMSGGPDAELRAAFGMIEDLMGRIYTDAPDPGDLTALAAWVWGRMSRVDGKQCPNCGEHLDAGDGFAIGPDGKAWCSDCAAHLGCGCASDPSTKAEGEVVTQGAASCSPDQPPER